MDNTFKKKKVMRTIKSVFKYILISIASLLGVLIVAFFIMLYGPFHTLRDYYVITMLETSAAKFMATAFFSEAKIQEILDKNKLIVPDENTDPTLVSVIVTTPTSATTPPVTTVPDTTSPPESSTTGGTSVSSTDITTSDTTTEAVTSTSVSTPPPTPTTVTTQNPYMTQGTAPDELFKDHPDAMPESDDYEGIQLVKVNGPTFTGYMLIISDPSRVRLSVSRSIIYTANGNRDWTNSYGEQLKSMSNRNNAVAAINGGAFYDPDGKGNGGEPDGVLCHEGKLLYWGPEEKALREYKEEKARIAQLIEEGEIDPDSEEAKIPPLKDTSKEKLGVIGINHQNILILGRYTKAEFIAQNFRDAVSFFYPNPPFLVINGKASTVVGTGGSGVQPRTCIGQRADGAFLFLVIDGRGAGGSLGATQKEAMDLLIEFGAVNAANLDGGSSSEMIIGGETISKPASIYGPRYMPDGFIVRHKP